MALRQLLIDTELLTKSLKCSRFAFEFEKGGAVALYHSVFLRKAFGDRELLDTLLLALLVFANLGYSFKLGEHLHLSVVTRLAQS